MCPAVRPGVLRGGSACAWPIRDGREGAPNQANYDEAIANPSPHIPAVLTLDDGRRVTSAEMWQTLRRPEIVEAFERDIYGRIPARVPGVAWTVAEELTGTLAGRPVRGRRLVGSGWGFAFLRPSSIQADNGAGLAKGIIGLTNKGRPRNPEDWGRCVRGHDGGHTDGPNWRYFIPWADSMLAPGRKR